MADPMRSLPAVLAAAGGLAGMWLLHSDAILSDPGVGRVRVTVVMSESRRPLPDATVYLNANQRGNNALPERFRWFSASASTDSHGRATLYGVPAGQYTLSASGRAHGVEESGIGVVEGEDGSAILMVKRTQPALAVSQSSHAFTTGATASIGVRGYAATAAEAVARVRVRAWRVRLEPLVADPATRSAYRSGANAGEVGGVPDGLLALSPHRDQPEVDQQATLRVSSAEGFFDQSVRLGKLPAGEYLAEISVGLARAWTALHVTDLAVVTKRAGGAITAFVCHSGTGEPTTGARVRLFAGAALPRDATTGPDGIARLALPPATARPGGGAPLEVVYAASGESEAVVGREIYGDEENGRYAVAVYSDRPIYRPGQQVHFKGIARQVLDPGARYALPAGEPVQVEVRNPDDDAVYRTVCRTNAMGSFSGAFQPSPEERNGSMTIICRIRGEAHTASIQFASYRKPEFEVSVAPERPRYVAGDVARINVRGAYYFGAPLAGAHVRYTIYSEIDWMSEDPDYDPSTSRSGRYASEYGSRARSGDGVLDSDGRLTLQVPAAVGADQDSPQCVRYTCAVQVTDATQRLVSADASYSVSAGDVRLNLEPDGYLARPGAPMGARCIARDLDGHPVGGIRVRVSTYMNEDRATGAPLEGVTGRDGVWRFEFRPTEAGEVRIQARATDRAGREVPARAYVTAAGSEGLPATSVPGSIVLSSDKRRYRSGETARVLMSSDGLGAAALVTVEGPRLYRAFVIRLQPGGVVLQIPVIREYGPNVYIAACSVRGQNMVSGELAVRVAIPEREVRVSVAPDRLRARPGERVRYAIRTTDDAGRPIPAEFSLAVVDEAVYAIREDDPGLLTETFYPRRSNRVSTSSSLEVRYLGDADKAEPKIVTRRRFVDTASWTPHGMTDAGGRAEVSVVLPDNLTTWRATAIAETFDSRFGRNVAQCVSSKDLAIRIDQPRAAVVGDRFQITASLQNGTASALRVQVALIGQRLTPLGAARQSVQIAANSSAQVGWDVEAREAGDGVLRASVWSEGAAGAPQLTDAVEARAPVHPAGREITSSLAGEAVAGRRAVETVRLAPDSLPGSGSVTLRISGGVHGAIRDGLAYLTDYPYACVEQTTSRMLPMLYAGESPGAARRVRDAMARLGRFQMQDGAWGWWEHDAADPWMTAYVLLGAAEAARRSFPVNPILLRRGRRALARMVREVNPDTRAFMIHVIGLAGDPAAARKLSQDPMLGRCGPVGMAWLSLLNAPADGGRQRSPSILAAAIRGPDGMHWETPRSPHIAGDWSPIMTTATVVMALLAGHAAEGTVTPAVHWLMRSRVGEAWPSTRDTAWAIMALTRYVAAFPAVAGPTGARVLVDGRVARILSAAELSGGMPQAVVRISGAALTQPRSEIEIRPTGVGGSLFYSMDLRQIAPLSRPPGAAPSRTVIRRDYLRVVTDPNAAAYMRLEPITGAFRRGDRVRVRLTINAPIDLDYVLIEDRFPSVLECSQRGSEEEVVEYGNEWRWWYSYVDVRDDRVAVFAQKVPAGLHVFEYNLRAQTSGSGWALPAVMQELYAPDERAETAAARIEVGR